jgi:hypothetical protein
MDEPFEEEPEEPTPDELTIDELLAQERPERYDLDDQEWMEPVVRKERDRLLQDAAEQVAEEYARRLVHTREGVATQGLNTLLRRFKDGQFPLGFGDGDDWKKFYRPYLRAPLLIGTKKVQFGVATPQDLDEWIAEKVKAGEREQVRRAEAIDGATTIVTALREQRVGRVEDFRRGGGS